MTKAVEPNLSLRAEYDGALLGDKRRSERLLRIAEEVAKKPAASFPELFDEAGLEGAYRFLSNEHVKPYAMRMPHVNQTAERASEYDEVIVAHDTTTCNFGSRPREGLGVLQGKQYGFLAHLSLVIAPDETRQPLGTVSVQIESRKEKKPKKNKGRKKKHEAKESIRWLRGVDESEFQLKESARVVHVMDREGDSYELLADLDDQDRRFVIRVSHNRCVHDSPDELTKSTEKIRDCLQKAPVLAQRVISVSRRDGSPLPATRKQYPARKGRDATISASATTVTIKRPRLVDKEVAATLTLHVVRVFEENPPEGQPAVEWYLWTTEPITTLEQVWRIVDIYRARWVIEEFFKVLKSGCSYEQRQLETADGLLRALSMFLPIAWRLLLLRTLCHHDEDTPAKKALTPTQLRCLGAALKPMRHTLPSRPTVRDALLGIAKLGGHLKRNGEPGWIVLGRGFEKLLLLEEGFRLATLSP